MSVNVKIIPAVNFLVIRLQNVITVKILNHKSIVMPRSYIDSCLCRNAIERGHHEKIYSKNCFTDNSIDHISP